VITWKEGDLFASGLPALAHGVNCRGVMGAGIAIQFRQRWPEMYESYRKRCTKPGEINPGYGSLFPGDVVPWRDTRTGALIFNLATQLDPGPCAQQWMITTAAGRMISMARYDYGITEIGLPLIGCGIGGLDPDGTELAAALAPYENAPVNLTVFRLPSTQAGGQPW
jgi:O-acetyl-ADP-ribose deacetylase (regulator of RNase III)